MEFSILTTEEYNAFQLHHSCRDFMNSCKALELKKMNQWEVEFVGVKEGTEILCATALSSIPIMKVYRFYYAQRGFLIDYRDTSLLSFFTENLQSYLKKRKGLYLIVDPNVLYKERDIEGKLIEDGFNHQYVIDNMQHAGYEHQGFTTDFQVVSEVRWMFSLYLDGKDSATLLKEMQQQTRWSVNKTIKQGIKVRELSIDELDYFLNMMKHTSERCGFIQREPAFYRKQMEVYGEQSKLLLGYLDVDDYKEKLQAERDAFILEKQEIANQLKDFPNSKKFIKKLKVVDEALELNDKKYKEMQSLEEEHGTMIPLATSFFIIFEDEVTYLYSAAYDSFKKYNAPYAIQWHMLQYASQNGIRKYNFYGLSGDFTKESQDYGVYEFKKGFNGVVEELVGDFILPIQKGPYALYRKLKNK